MSRFNLFQSGLISEYLEHLKQGVLGRAQNLSEQVILSNSDDQILESVYEEFFQESPTIVDDGIYLEEEPKEESKNMMVRDWDGEMLPRNIKTLKFIFCVPFQGEESLLKYQPTSFANKTFSKFTSEVRDQIIKYAYSLEIEETGSIETLFGRDVDLLKQNLQNVKRDVDAYDSQIKAIALPAIQKRRQEIEKKQMVTQGLTIPIKRRADVSQTYTVPEVKRKAQIVLKNTNELGKQPDPTLDMAEYVHILKILRSMSIAMERSPKTFEKLTEEEIRDFFLLALNGHYEGPATGETFNGLGKTDILIRYKEENIFIGECKFWMGKVYLLKAIEQLFGYTTWRDTKTSIIIFNKGKDLTAVVAKVAEIIEAHPNFKRRLDLGGGVTKDKGTLSYVISHPKDSGLEIVLTVMIFQVLPSEQTES